MKRRQFIQLATVTSLAAGVTNLSAETPEFAGQNDLTEATISDLQAKMQSGQMSSADIAAKYLQKIKEVDGQINSIIETNPEALKIAEELDKERKSGQIRSVTFTPANLKDFIG